MVKQLCPCHSGKSYAVCCAPFHQGRLPETALLLMRSRYAAYALNLAEYIMQTTHPASPQYIKDRAVWAKQIEAFSLATQFEQLEILDFQERDAFATVTFIAHLKQGRHDATFTEESHFEKVDGRWLYCNGIV